MTYINAQRVLPETLLDEIRRYIPQGYLYIAPEAARKPWGSVNGSRQKIRDRNQSICKAYQRGTPVKILAEQYHLAENSIYHILRNS